MQFFVDCVHCTGLVNDDHLVLVFVLSLSLSESLGTILGPFQAILGQSWGFFGMFFGPLEVAVRLLEAITVPLEHILELGT